MLLEIFLDAGADLANAREFLCLELGNFGKLNRIFGSEERFFLPVKEATRN